MTASAEHFVPGFSDGLHLLRGLTTQGFGINLSLQMPNQDVSAGVVGAPLTPTRPI